jgi:peptidyl-tRNA hydrolase ICT1
MSRTETKAITTWPVSQLLAVLPKMLHSGLRESKYYTGRNDCISVQAQTSRSRTANAEENHQKLFEELQRLYKETVPGETSNETRQKYNALYVRHLSISEVTRLTSLDRKKSANHARVDAKRLQGSKKVFRKGRPDDY